MFPPRNGLIHQTSPVAGAPRAAGLALAAGAVFCLFAGCSSPSPGGGRGPAAPGTAATNAVAAPLAEYACQVFTVQPPAGGGWKEVERGTNKVVYAILNQKAVTHELSFVAWEEPWPIPSPEDFVRFTEARHTKRFFGPTDLRNFSFVAVTNHSPLEVQWTVESRPIQEQWIVRATGYEIRHPGRPDYFVRAMYRQVARTVDFDKQRLAEVVGSFNTLKLQ